MEALKNRKIAWIILIAVILLMTPLGMKLSLERAVRKVEDGFEKGHIKVSSGGFSQGTTSVTEYAGQIVNHSRNLVSVVRNVEELSPEVKNLSEARIRLEDAKTMNGVCEALDEVAAAVEALEAAKEGVTLSDKDQANWSLFSGNLNAALSNASEEIRKYNASVDEFCDGVLSKFPASLIARLLSVEAPERLGGGV